MQFNRLSTLTNSRDSDRRLCGHAFPLASAIWFGYQQWQVLDCELFELSLHDLHGLLLQRPPSIIPCSIRMFSAAHRIGSYGWTTIARRLTIRSPGVRYSLVARCVHLSCVHGMIWQASSCSLYSHRLGFDCPAQYSATTKINILYKNTWVKEERIHCRRIWRAKVEAKKSTIISWFSYWPFQKQPVNSLG